VINMRIVHVFFMCCLLVALVPGFACAQVTAKVNRTSMVIDETLTLTITKDGTSFFSDPDLEPLTKDFKVLGQSQSSNTRIINGSASSSVEWHVALSPRRTGKLEILPISLGKEKTNALSVRVREANQPTTRAENAPIFIETEVDADSVYVQSQVILTLRLFAAVEARIIDPPDPEIEDVLVKRLGDSSFDKMVNGKSFKVFERKYAIFPQKSGTLEISPFVVDIILPSRQRSRSLFDQFTTRGENIKLRSKADKITALEKFPEYPDAAVWLPTSILAVDDKWNNNSQELKVGESTTITISLTAEGLMGEQLPPIGFQESDGLKLYQGKAEVENIITANGINGVREESIALIPTQAGTFELPEIRIPWWNKILGKIEYAVVPARQLVVKGPSVGTELRDNDNIAVGDSSQGDVDKLSLQPVVQSQSTALIILSSFLAVGWLITLYLLIITRRQVLLHGKMRKHEMLEDFTLKEKEAFIALSKSCKENSPLAARKDFMSWVQAFNPEVKIQTFSDVEKVYSDRDFAMQLKELDRLLYDFSESSDQWQGSRLLEQVSKLRKMREKTPKEKNLLERLYK